MLVVQNTKMPSFHDLPDHVRLRFYTSFYRVFQELLGVVQRTAAKLIRVPPGRWGPQSFRSPHIS